MTVTTYPTSVTSISSTSTSLTDTFQTATATAVAAITVELSETVTVIEGGRYFSGRGSIDDDSCALAGLCNTALTRVSR